MEKALKTTRVMTSWRTLSWAAESPALWPRRLAGTWKQYSGRAMSQLTRMTSQSAACLYLRWPYQAKVMKTLESVRRRAVLSMCVGIIGERRGRGLGLGLGG